MSKNNEGKSEGFFASLGAFISSLSLKIQLVFGAIVGVFGFVAFYLFSKRKNNRDILELELKKVREEIEIEKAQEEIDKNNEVIEALESRAEEIVKEIEKIDVPDPEREVTHKELDDFFDKRGF